MIFPDNAYLCLSYAKHNTLFSITCLFAFANIPSIFVNASKFWIHFAFFILFRADSKLKLMKWNFFVFYTWNLGNFYLVDYLFKISFENSYHRWLWFIFDCWQMFNLFFTAPSLSWFFSCSTFLIWQLSIVWGNACFLLAAHSWHNMMCMSITGLEVMPLKIK